MLEPCRTESLSMEGRTASKVESEKGREKNTGDKNRGSRRMNSIAGG